jgi:hypothetical protein
VLKLGVGDFGELVADEGIAVFGVCRVLRNEDGALVRVIATNGLW